VKAIAQELSEAELKPRAQAIYGQLTEIEELLDAALKIQDKESLDNEIVPRSCRLIHVLQNLMEYTNSKYDGCFDAVDNIRNTADLLSEANNADRVVARKQYFKKYITEMASCEKALKIK